MKVLLVSQRPSDFVEMKRAALALRKRGWTISFVYYFEGNQRPEDDEVEAELNGLVRGGILNHVAWFNRTIPPDPAAGPKPVKRRSIRGFLTSIWHRYAGQVFTAKVYRELLDAYRAVLQQERPQVIILPEDVVGMVCPLFIRAGHLEGIPSVVLPYTICNEQEAFRSLSGLAPVQMGYRINRLVALLFPNWVMEQDGKRILRLPGTHIIGHWLAGCMPPDPWMMNSGWADAIAVENEAMRLYYRVSGVPASRLKVVGAVYDDEIAGIRGDKLHRRTVLNRQLDLNPEKPLLVVAGCPDQSRVCPRFAYASLTEFADKLAEVLVPLKERYEIVFRPHPNLVGFMHLMRERGITVTTMETSYLVALADAYIGFASATIRWAIACAVPIINYDVFAYGYSDFRHVPSVRTVDNHAAFAEAALRLPGTFQWPNEGSGEWGRLDGRSTERIVDLIQKVAA